MIRMAALHLFLCLFVFFAPFSLQAENIFKVGIITVLSGPAAPFGVSIRNSMELAVSDNPARFKQIKFIYEDVGYDTKQAVTAFHKLVKIDKVDLVYTWGLNFCKALAPMAESAHTPLVTQCLLPDVSKDRNFVLRFYSSSDDYMRKQAEMLAAKKLNRMALLVADTAHLQEMVVSLKRALRSNQRIELEESFLPSESDFRTVIEKVRRANVQVVGVFLSTGQIATFYKQAKALSLQLPSFGSNWLDSQQEVDAANGAMNGAMFVTTGFKPAFQSKYLAKYGEPGILTFGGPAYELAMIIGKLFGDSSAKRNSEEIINSFSKITPQEGTASGPFYFAETPTTGKYVDFPIVAKIIRNGQIVAVP